MWWFVSFLLKWMAKVSSPCCNLRKQLQDMQMRRYSMTCFQLVKLCMLLGNIIKHFSHRALNAELLDKSFVSLWGAHFVPYLLEKRQLHAGTVRNWHVSMTVIVCYLFVSLILYSIGLIVSRHAQSYIKSGIESDLDDSWMISFVAWHRDAIFPRMLALPMYGCVDYGSYDYVLCNDVAHISLMSQKERDPPIFCCLVLMNSMRVSNL